MSLKDKMIYRVLKTVFLSGLLAGILISGVQMLKVVPLIFHAENLGVNLSDQINVPEKTENLKLDPSEDEWMPEDGFERRPAGDLVASNLADRMLTATREGLIRMWIGPHLVSRRRLLFEEIASGDMRRLDWEQRQVIFEAARDAEDSGMLSRAIELYESLGRAEDVRRLISQREGADV